MVDGRLQDSMEIYVEVAFTGVSNQKDSNRLKRKPNHKIALEDQTNKKPRKLFAKEENHFLRTCSYNRIRKQCSPVISECFLDILPNEILVNIFKMLPALSRSQTLLVSRRWNKITVDSKIMDSYEIDGYGMMIKNSIRHKKGIDDYIAKKNHVEINIEMRCILIDWMIEVSTEFKMQMETTFLATAIIDRYLSKIEANIPRARFQLLGVTALLIASKIEELSAPTISDLVYICDNTYSREEILSMEANMLNILEFDLNIFTSRHFLQHLLNSISENEPTIDTSTKITLSHFANYLVELSLLEYKLNMVSPSLIAASAISLARLNSGISSWTCMLQEETYITLKHMEPICNILSNLFMNASTKPWQATYLKFSSPKFQQVSTKPIFKRN